MKRPSSKAIEKLVERFAPRVTPHVNKWLAGFAGYRFDSLCEAQCEVARIKQVVSAAGCVLVLGHERVNIVASIGTRQTKPSIKVVAQRMNRGKTISSTVEFPKLQARPVRIESY